MPLTPTMLHAGDSVLLVSPASTPSREHVQTTTNYLTQLGLNVQLGKHVFDQWGYLAGRDEDRLADFNHGLRDPAIRAVIATRGGKGAYRIAGQLDFAACSSDPKVIVGFSEITVLHLALYSHCGLSAIHGAPWLPSFSKRSAESFYQTAFSNDDVLIQAERTESTSTLTTTGVATGILVGGNQEMVATALGWALPDLEGKILLLEAFGLRLGQMDRQLTMLQNSGALQGLAGVAVGQFTDCEPDATTQGNWTAIDVLRDRLHRLNVPVLGGLPIGHGDSPLALPVGTTATLDADKGTLSLAPAVQ